MTELRKIENTQPYDVPGLPPEWVVVLCRDSNLNAEIERELIASHPHHGRVTVWVGRSGISSDTLDTLRNRVAQKRPTITSIFLDVDEVLVNWVDDALRLLGHNPADVHKRWAALSPRPWDLFAVLNEDPAEAWALIHAAGASFWSRLADYPWADELLGACEDFAATTLLTSPSQHPSSYAGKSQWMRETFGPGFSNYAFTRAKHRFAHPGALLIDDSPKNCRAFRDHGGHAILFPGIGNDLHHIPGDERVAYVREQLKGYRQP